MGTEGDQRTSPAAGVADIAPTRQSAVEILAGKIHELIALEHLRVGDSLPSERELCERFDTSRNTVREAMRMLKAYGIVDVRPKVGATIIDNRMARAFDLFSFNPKEVTRKTFVDIQSFRSLLEVASVELIFDRLRSEDIEHLREINEGLRNPVSIEHALETDFSFHIRLISVLGNRAILDVYNIMKPVILRIMEKGKTRGTFSTETLNEHNAVVDALKDRNRIRYQYALQSHLDRGFARFRDTATDDERETTNNE